MQPQVLLLILAALAASTAYGQNDRPTTKVEIDVTKIKTAKELPRLMYIIPWQDTQVSPETDDRQIIIHDLFGDFYRPMAPGFEAHATPRKDVDQ